MNKSRSYRWGIKYINRLLSLLLVILLVTSCQTVRKTGTKQQPKEFVTAKVTVRIPGRGGSLTKLNGNLRMISGERIQLSVLMPILRSEMARLEITPEEVWLIDRMNKRYVQATRQELNPYLPTKANYHHLEKLLLKASKNKKEYVLTTDDFGFPGLKDGKIKIYNFSNQPFTMPSSQWSVRYKRVELFQLIEMLTNL